MKNSSTPSTPQSAPAANEVWHSPRTGVTRTVAEVRNGRVFYSADSLPGVLLSVRTGDFIRWMKDAKRA